jgi:hypothetical protein
MYYYITCIAYATHVNIILSLLSEQYYTRIMRGVDPLQYSTAEDPDRYHEMEKLYKLCV